MNEGWKDGSKRRDRRKEQMNGKPTNAFKKIKK